MCTGVEAALVASAVSGVAGVQQAYVARGDAKESAARASQERADAETKAVQDASAKIAMQRRALRENSLFTGGGTATAAPPQGRSTLGVG